MTKFVHIPKELQRLRQWVCVPADSKIPMRPLCHKSASSVDPTTWCDMFDAVESLARGYHEYGGFVFADNGLVGIDIDDGYDEEGFMTPLAADIIGRCKSYTEKSKSGKGFHIILKGELPFTGKNNLAGVEIYKSARYFIMTGDVLLYHEAVENQSAIDYVLDRYFPETVKENDSRNAMRIYNPVWSPPEHGRIKLRPSYPHIQSGCRNVCLTSLAGMLHNQGYNKDQIYEEVSHANATACDPPLDRREIQSIVNSVTRYIR